VLQPADDHFDDLRSLLRPSDDEQRGPRRWATGLGLALVLAALLLAGSTLRAPHPPADGAGAATAPAEDPPAPATTVTATTPTAGRLWPPGDAGTPTVVAGGHRFEVGRPGDVVAVADWRRDGSATVAVLRPGTGEVAVFADWPDEGEEASATVVSTFQGATALRAGSRCGEGVVSAGDGTTHVVRTTPGPDQP
jgi:hypothetical protein